MTSVGVDMNSTFMFHLSQSVSPLFVYIHFAFFVFVVVVQTLQRIAGSTQAISVYCLTIFIGHPV